ncbi:MAG TPA: response regulator transcription factor [Planctomycetota bacterium]|jgi:two-component system OmpR family response regulator|nr:response regulator transcription factor [Planctomycetota bacterium]
MRVLVVDDDPDFRSFVLAGLRRVGIDSEGASDGLMAKELLDRVGVEPFDLILLDVKMPGQSGWDLLLELRELGRETPVIFLSGLDSVEERVKGLRLGADDYVPKEFDFDELVARIGAVIRRRRSLAPIEYADLKLDLAKRTAWRGGQQIVLSPREFDLLRTLVSRAGQVVSRSDLLREVWSLDIDPQTNVVDVHVARLRRKLDGHGVPLIQTVRGEGYRLAVPGGVF